jgi:hypothetical protein
MTQLKKKSLPAKSSVISSAWDAFFDAEKTQSIEELYAEGWIDILSLAERLGISTNGARGKTKAKEFKREYFHVKHDGSRRKMLFVKRLGTCEKK